MGKNTVIQSECMIVSKTLKTAKYLKATWPTADGIFLYFTFVLLCVTSVVTIQLYLKLGF